MVPLGRVEAPSGIVLVIDMGLLGLWSHTRVPRMDEDEDVAAIANTAEDLRFEGKDAYRAAQAYGRQWHPGFLYDVPAKFVDEAKRDVAALGLDARLVAGPRVPHRTRVTQALEAGKGAGIVQFHGIPAIAISGLPPGRALDVMGERMGEGAHADRLRRVTLEVLPGPKAARSVCIGDVGVDKARLMFVDPDALGAWRHEAPVDGMADFVFWGRDAAEAAAAVKAPKLVGDEFGWRDLPVDAAAERGLAVEELRDARGWKFAIDFRPHSDHFRALALMRASDAGAGTIKVGRTPACALFTSWGDGFFPVWADFDEAGSLARIRVELAPGRG